MGAKKCHFCKKSLKKDIKKMDAAHICNSCIHYVYTLINTNRSLIIKNKKLKEQSELLTIIMDRQNNKEQK